MDFLEFARSRFSTRRFTSHEVEQDKVDKIVEAGLIAPTAANRQPQKIYVIRSPKMIQVMNQLTPCIYGATTVFMVAYDETLDWKNPMEEGVHDGMVDASIVGTHMMLEATELGLGSCWVGHFPPTKTARTLGLPDHIKPVLLLPVGYTDPSYEISPQHNSFRDYDEIVTLL